MFPDEISLPTGIIFYQPNIGDCEELSFDQISTAIRQSTFLQLAIKKRTLLIINDSHRSTPSHIILKAIFESYDDHQIKAIAIATGTHKLQTEKELKHLFEGVNIDEKIEIIIHDCLSEDLRQIGKTSRGTEVKINQIIDKYETIIAINSVEPHYFAGFTGGIKSIIPGLAARITVEKNHSWAIHKDSGPMLIENNPVQVDLREAGALISRDFIGIQLVNVGKDILHISIGELFQAHAQAMEISRKVFSAKSPIKYDIIVSVVYPPLDRSLYQAQKGIENTRQALKNNGTIILVAKCFEGIGNKHFYDTLTKFNQPKQVLDQITIENYRFGDHKAVKFASMANNGSIKILGELSSTQCKTVFADSINTLELEELLYSASRNGKKIAIVLDSGTLVLH